MSFLIGISCIHRLTYDACQSVAYEINKECKVIQGDCWCTNNQEDWNKIGK